MPSKEDKGGAMKSVLIVDDEVGTRESLRMILKNDYEVLLAKNAEEAFQMVKERSPDVILLDIILPDLDGLKVLEKIKQKDSDIDHHYDHRDENGEDGCRGDETRGL